MPSVLLSVRSLPNGQPVQKAPKAYFWTIGPSTSPPIAMPTTATQAYRLDSGRPRTAARAARIPIIIDTNIVTTCGISTRAGTSPLKRITMGSPSGTRTGPVGAASVT